MGPPMRKCKNLSGGHRRGRPVFRATARVAPTALREPCLKFGGRVRTPAPTVDTEAAPSFRRGRTLAGPQMYAARPGGRALQPSTSCHLLGKSRRRGETAPAAILEQPGPSGPVGIRTSHSDFARRKFCTTLQVRVPVMGVLGGRLPLSRGDGRRPEGIGMGGMEAGRLCRTCRLRPPPRPCLKNVNMPKRRAFFRHTALIFLAIHKVLPHQIALSGKKIPRR